MTWQASYIQNITSFRTEKNILELGAGDFSTAIFLAKRNQEKTMFSEEEFAFFHTFL